MLTVTAGVIRWQDKVLIARRAGNDPLAGKWEFPGGKVERGETPEECLARELHEEFGIRVRINGFLAETHYEYPGRRIRLLFYDVDYVSGEVTLTTHDEYDWARIESLPRYTFAPADVSFMNRLVAETRDGGRPAPGPAPKAAARPEREKPERPAAPPPPARRRLAESVNLALRVEQPDEDRKDTNQPRRPEPGRKDRRPAGLPFSLNLAVRRQEDDATDADADT
jgi:8-oxo-dGTP diphosphatase